MTTKNIYIKVGNKFTIVLETNPSAGYQWYLDYDNSKLKLISESTQYGNNGLIGAPNKKKYVFQLIKLGKSKINCYYNRPNEDQGTPQRIYKIHSIKY
jgi:inhibitor of cysteine peptidase